MKIGADADDPTFDTALLSCVQHRNYDMVEFLLQNGANPILRLQFIKMNKDAGHTKDWMKEDHNLFTAGVKKFGKKWPNDLWCPSGGEPNDT